MKEHKLFKIIWDYMTLIIGGILCGISISFLLPAKLTTGGFSGIATIIYFLTEFPVETGLILLNIPAFLITGKVIGIKYSVRSFVGMMFSSLGVVIGEFIPVLTTDVMLAALYGGLLSGLGMALTYRAGGSTGGTDLIARLLHEKKQHINIGEILLIVDGIIIAALSLIFDNIEIGLYSMVAAFVMTKMIDLILEGADFAKAVFVITNKEKEIAEYIHNDIKRTSTKINAIGTYTNTEKIILMCVVNKKQIPRLKAKIAEIDREAFTIVTTVTEAIGQGFKEN